MTGNGSTDIYGVINLLEQIKSPGISKTGFPDITKL